MPILANNNDCCGCGACENICSANCITMLSDSEGFSFPTVDYKKCIACGMCEKVCPIVKFDDKLPCDIKASYAAFSKNEKIRLESSSGGVFSELAMYVLQNGGAVFGCRMSKDCKTAFHTLVETEDKLQYLRGSKYVQSEICLTYRKTKELLTSGRQVLYSGTPCQIAGLKAYLGSKSYNNLFTVDFICHGAASPVAWKRYLQLLEDKFNTKAISIFFRNKLYGWKIFNLTCNFENKFTYRGKIGEDLFLKGFVSNYYLRKSCYSCKFKGESIQSDVTLGDFWGVENALPEINDNKGLSVVLVHSDNGQHIINAVSEKMTLIEVPAEKALASNPSYCKSVPKNKIRKAFFKDLNRKKYVFEKYCGSTLFSRITKRLINELDKSEW